jgi:hypothetical protein
VIKDFEDSGNDLPWKSLRGSITSAVIGEGITVTGKDMFQRCTVMTTATLPSTLITVGQSTFHECNALTSADLSGTKVTLIRGLSFFRTKLSTIKLPSTISTIQNEAFRSCTYLNSIEISRSSPPTLTNGANTFRDVNIQNITLVIPDDGVGEYGTTAVWKDMNIPQLIITFDANGGEWE